MPKTYYKVRKDNLDDFISGVEHLYFIVTHQNRNDTVIGVWSDGEADTYDEDYFEDNFELTDPPPPTFMLQLTTSYSDVNAAMKAAEEVAAKLNVPVQVIHV